MNIGQFDRRVLIEKKAVAHDPDYGTEVVSWVPLATVWANVQDALPSRTEETGDNLAKGKRQTRIRYRFRSDVDSSMRVTVLGTVPRLMQIIGSPAEIGRKEYSEINCEAYTSGGERVSEVHVTGLAELQALLDTLPAKIEANVIRGALRAGMKTVLPVAKQGVHSVSGELAKGLKLSTSLKNGVANASIKAKGPHAFVAIFVEYGTAAHTIKAKNGLSLFFGGLFAQSIHHPGARAHPFMRPALDGQAGAAVVAAAEYMKNRLASKEGLDTSDIEITAEEST